MQVADTLNTDCVDIGKLANKLNETTTHLYDQNNNYINNNNNNNNSNSLNNSKKSSFKSKTSKKNQNTNNNNAATSDAGPDDYEPIDLTCQKLQELVKTARLTHNISNLKSIIRNNGWSCTHKIRKYLWSCLLQINNVDINKIKNDYNDDLNSIFGQAREIHVSLPKFVNKDEHLNYYYLNQNGIDAVKRILCVYAHRYPDITYSPALISICSLLLHYMQEHEVYAALCYMFSTKDYLIETRSSWETNCLVFSKLSRMYCKSGFDLISKSTSEPIESIVSDWYWWIFDDLPFEHLVKIMDCFLLEGQKLLFRISLGIINLYTKNFKNENALVSKSSIKNFSQTSINSIDKLLKTSFSIRNLKRSTIKELYVKEIRRKTVRLTVETNDQTEPINDIHTIQPINSGTLNYPQIRTLWTWIPQRLTVYNPHLSFTSAEDGNSLTTFFNVIDNFEHCFIVIKTLQNEIFGAFCSGLWSERKQKSTYFGNGETFLFSLTPQTKLYRWVGLQKQKTLPNQDLFLRADSKEIAIGGGGSVGLFINGNLTEGFTNRCDTFNNEPLCSTQHFEISIIEVISFSGYNC